MCYSSAVTLPPPSPPHSTPRSADLGTPVVPSVTCSASVTIQPSNKLWHRLFVFCKKTQILLLLSRTRTRSEWQLCSTEGDTKYNSSFSLFSPRPPSFQASRPGSNEVLLLLAGAVVAEVLGVGVLAGGQLPRCPVGSFVVTEIPVEQEGQNRHRQQNHHNNHWEKKKHTSTSVWTRETSGNSARFRAINQRGAEKRDSYRRPLQSRSFPGQLLLTLNGGAGGKRVFI